MPAPRSKRTGANDTPARKRYRESGRLKERKIRNLMRYCRMTLAAATKLWEATRKRGRRKSAT